MTTQTDASLVTLVRDRLSREPGELTPHRVAAALRAAGRPVGDATVLAVHEQLRRDVVGAGPLEPLLRTPGTSDVLVNGCREVWIDRGDGLEQTEVTFPDEESVRRLAQRLVAGAGRRLDDAAPCADVRLADGTRCHAVLAPLARPGTLLSLRVPQTRALTIEQLIEVGSLSPPAARLVRRIITRRLAFLVTGGTGSGKTTLLSALLSLVPERERLVVVEDASELRPHHPHVVALEARPANAEGAGAVPLSSLVRQAMRMRPDRLVVGEVRGAEVTDLLTAMNTGHEGGCGTVHANSASDLPARIEALGLAAGMGRAAAHSQLTAALDAVVHVRRAADGRRYLSQVGVLMAGSGGVTRVEPAVTYDEAGQAVEGPGARQLQSRLESG